MTPTAVIAEYTALERESIEAFRATGKWSRPYDLIAEIAEKAGMPVADVRKIMLDHWAMLGGG